MADLTNREVECRFERTGINSIVFASSVGTIIEWYDFLIYGTAAALVFNTQFFPNIDPLAGTLASLATFSVGFGARPIGGVFDRGWRPAFIGSFRPIARRYTMRGYRTRTHGRRSRQGVFSHETRSQEMR